MVVISCTKRSAPRTAVSSGRSTLTATWAVVLEVRGQIDGRHAAFAQVAFDTVAVRESGREPGGDLGHGELGLMRA